MSQYNSIIVMLFAVSLFTIAKCFCIRDELMEPIDTTRVENINKEDSLGQPRFKREVFRLDGRISQPARVQSREQTVIVLPDRGSTSYRSLPNSPYGSSSLPNRGTTVVVSQVPDYSYNLPRTYDIMPVRPIRK